MITPMRDTNSENNEIDNVLEHNGDSNSNDGSYLYDDKDDNSSTDSKELGITHDDKNIDREELDMFLTHQIPEIE